MRKVYILRDNEEDGAVLDALQAQGLEPDEGDVSNPVCPLCGEPTLLAWSEGDEFEVLTWFCLVEEDEETNPDAWYLVCSSFTCGYEEQVARVDAPMDAIIFDLQSSHSSFDDYSGIVSRTPDEMQTLIDYLGELIGDRPNRKLQCILAEAEWRRDDDLRTVREWLAIIPGGRYITFSVGDEKLQASFITATDDRLLVRSHPDGEMLAVSVGAIDFYGPKYFDPRRAEPPDPPVAERLRSEKMIILHPAREKVVIRGHHLRLEFVDRLGQYHVGCTEPAAAGALDLEQRSETYWRGRFRRSDIEARYDVKRMVRVQGHWLDVWGESEVGRHPAVKTRDPAVAVELGLEPWRSWSETDRPECERTILFWHGKFPQEEIAEEKEVRIYHWPIPELQTSDAQE